MAGTDFDFGRFDALTFDCYGTLIDWEAGILAALRPIVKRRGLRLSSEELLEDFGRHEALVEAGPFQRYRDVLGSTLRNIATEQGFEPTVDEIRAFGRSVEDWPAFPDSAAALAKLQTRYRLGVITNCDDDLFAASARRLGVTFDWVVTAEQVGEYKPSERNFELAFERLGLPRDRILHCAQSLFHDHVPAKRLGLSTVWVDRRHGVVGSGATPPASAEPDITVPDMATLAELAIG